MKGSITDNRIIGADILRDLHVWVDTLHAVHKNIQGHTGSTMYMGRSAMYNKSSKQKLNIQSTTNLELVGVSKHPPYDL